MVKIEDVVFLCKNETAKLLRCKDDYINHYSNADVLLRGGENIDNLLEVFSKQALDWEQDEIERICSVLRRLDSQLEKLKFRYNFECIFIAKTTGQEEGGEVFYTRSKALIISAGRLKLSSEALYSNLSHELFHIFSKQNCNLKDVLYNLIGFKKCKNLHIPIELRKKIITNPDGYDLYYKCLKECCFLPIIVGENNENKSLFDNIQVLYVNIHVESNGEYIEYDEMNQIMTISEREYQCYIEEMGGSIIFNDHHPDEVLADIFCYLLSTTRNSTLDANTSINNVLNYLFSND